MPWTLLAEIDCLRTLSRHVSELLLQSVGLIATESEFEEIIPYAYQFAIRTLQSDRADCTKVMSCYLHGYCCSGLL